MSAPAIDVETLLEHREFLRRIVRGLLADENRVDDVLQETWMAALGRPGLRQDGLRAWLAAVARNFARKALRSEVRRRKRERAVARPEGTEDDLVRQVAWQKRVVDAVLALEEPSRTAVLRRYLRDETPASIATDLGVPAATVRTRIHRGLERLRARLDREGSRREWALALLPLLGGELRRPSRAPSVARRGLLAASLLALALLVAGVVAVVSIDEPEIPEPPAERRAEVPEAGQIETGRPRAIEALRRARPLVVSPGRPAPPRIALKRLPRPGRYLGPAVRYDGAYRGPDGEVPPMLREPGDPQPLFGATQFAKLGRLPSPRRGVQGERPRTTQYADWVFWWLRSRDEIFQMRAARRRRPSVADADRRRAAEALEAFVADLSIPASSRATALLALGRAGQGRTTLRRLALAETDADRALRQAAILGLGLHADWGMEDRVLVADLFTGPTATRAFASLAVALAGEEDPLLVSRLESVLRWPDHADSFACAALALGRVGGEDAGRLVLAGTRRKPEVESLLWRAHRADALGECEGTRVASALLGLLRSDDVHARRSAALALGRFHGDPGPIQDRVLAETDTMARAFALIACGRIAARSEGEARAGVRAFLLERLAMVEDATRPYAALALGVLGDGAVALPLRRILESPEDPADLRGAAAIGLGLLGDRESIAALVAILADDRPGREVLGPAACAAGLIGGDPAIRRALETRVRAPGDPDVLRNALVGMALLGGPEAAATLIREMESPRGTSLTLAGAVQGLGLLRPRAAIRPLIRILEDGKRNHWHRGLAAAALGGVLERREVSALARLGSDRNHRALPRSLAAALANY